MPEYIDVHSGMHGVITQARNAAVAIQDQESVSFKHAWADPASGMIFCLSEAPGAEAVRAVHRRSGQPTDDVYEVPVQV